MRAASAIDVRSRVLPRTLLALGACSFLLCHDAPSEARPITVRGTTKLRAQARFVGQNQQVLELRGRLSDDGEQPVAAVMVKISAPPGLNLRKGRACNEPRTRVLIASSALQAETNDDGGFCLRWLDSPAAGTLSIEFSGDPLRGGTRLKVGFDQAQPQRISTLLRFTPRPVVLDLDRDSLSIGGLLSLTSPTAHAPHGGLSVTLHDETQTELAKTTTRGDGKARFAIATDKLGEPGSGRLTIRFDGNETLEAATDDALIIRRASVRLTLTEPPEPTPIGSQISLRLSALAAGKPVQGGIVEALRAGASLATSPVERGAAELHLVVPSSSAGDNSVSIRYVPAGPYYGPGTTLATPLPVAPPSPWARLLMTALVAAAAGWILLGWRRARALAPPPRPRPSLMPGVHVLESDVDGNRWQGSVVDAHEAQSLPGAQITVRAPSLDGDGLLISVVTDENGRFAFELDHRPQSAELIVRGRDHSEERKPLPAPGTMRVALITRRRAALRRFVRWTKVRGQSDALGPDPTPGQVHQRAHGRGQSEVAEWANQVQHAAFGPKKVDETEERRLRELEPGPH